jgi:amino-acid N-acetyltransferase
MSAAITRARPEDLDAVLGLLTDASLPQAGVAEHFHNFLVACEGGRLVGAVGLERYGPSALFRSLVVTPAHQGRGLGRALTERMLDDARKTGVKRLFLLTDTAAEFFPKFGFRRIAREEADPEVQDSVEFRTACGQLAVCMRLDL